MTDRIARQIVEKMYRTEPDPFETPDPPEAPAWMDADTAYGWQCGWTAGYEARAGRS